MFRREIPPTAGRPLPFGDLVPRAGATLADSVATQLEATPLQPTCSGTAAFTIALAALRERAPRRAAVVAPACAWRSGRTPPLPSTGTRHSASAPSPKALSRPCR